MKRLALLALGNLLAQTGQAAGLGLDIELPRLTVAEYHRPYVAVWIERPDHSVAANLALWYDGTLRHDEGSKWLKDLRQWWRRSGRAARLPLDGITGATRAPGLHRLQFVAGQTPLATLAPGAYRLQVEAAREAGGHERLTLPFQWPPTETVHLSAQGQHELGRLRLTLAP